MVGPTRFRRSVELHGDRAVWFGAAACAGALAAAEPFAAIVAMTIPLLYFLLARAPITALITAIAFTVSFTRAEARLHRHEIARLRTERAARWPTRCDVEGTVARSPSMIGDALRVDVDANHLDCGRALESTRITLLIPHDMAPSLGRGDVVVAEATLAPPHRFANEARDMRVAQARRGVHLSGRADVIAVHTEGRGLLTSIDRLRDRNRRRIQSTFPAETSGMARALVLGEEDLATDDQRAFRRSGLAHLLAVSGMHLVLVVVSFVALVRAVLVRIPALATRLDTARIAASLGVPAAFIYAELAGASGSAVRAAWMMSVAFLARTFGRPSDGWRALGLSILIMIAADPLVPFDLSFTLSALATLGLLSLARPIEASLAKRWPFLPSFITQSFAASSAATITCAPVLASMAAELPVAGLFANIVAVPIGEAVALPLCLAHALLAQWPAAEQGCALAASGALGIVRGIARVFAWGVLPVPPPTPLQVGVLAASTAGFVMARRPRRWVLAGVIGILVLELYARMRGAPTRVLRATFLDVGQGDAALVDLPDGSAMLIDGGGLVGSPLDVGERVLAPVLASRRRSRIEIVVLSHPHPDHYGGLRAGLERVAIGSVWDTGQADAEHTWDGATDPLSFARAKGVAIRRPAELCGTHHVGGATVEVLAPCPVDFDRGPNDNSFVVRIRYGRRAFLFVGDAERAQESDLIAKYGDGLRADLLKVGHHGSRTSSTPGFIAAVRPAYAIISCGVRNRFGHPHAITLETLANAEAHVFRTDRDGAIVATTDGDTLTVGPSSPSLWGF